MLGVGPVRFYLFVGRHNLVSLDQEKYHALAVVSEGAEGKWLILHGRKPCRR
jgi:hypothetical protein